MYIQGSIMCLTCQAICVSTTWPVEKELCRGCVGPARCARTVHMMEQKVLCFAAAQAGSEETKSNILPCTVQTAVTVAVMPVDKCIKTTVATAAAAIQLANSCCPEKWLRHFANDHNVVYPQLLSSVAVE